MVFVQYKLCPWGAEVVFGPASFFPGFIYHTYRWASTGNSYACHDHHNLAGIGLMFLAAMWWWFCLIMKAMDRNFSPWNSYKSQIKYWCETDEIIRINAFIANKFIFSPVICFGLVSLGGWPSMTHRFASVVPLSRWQISKYIYINTNIWWVTISDSSVCICHSLVGMKSHCFWQWEAFRPIYTILV